MTRALLAILLALAVATPVHAAPRRLPVTATVYGDGLRVSWPAVAGAAVACVTRPGGQQLLGCGRAGWRQGSVDERLRVGVGETVEVRVWDAGGTLVAQGWATVRGAVYLPSVGKAKPPPR